MSWPVGRFPTIPEYYKEAIDHSVALVQAPKQCCPFHKEDTPSFSYSIEKMVWSCFGACHAVGKDVVEMHRRNYKMNTREEAEASLRFLCQYPKITPKHLIQKIVLVNDEEVEQKQLEQEATILADTPDRWLELDYVMSKYPVSVYELRDLVNKWKMKGDGYGS